MRWVGFIRNVMLGREGLHRGRLLELVEAAGGHSPHSFLTTGNVTFTAPPAELGTVVQDLETALEPVLGRHEMVAARSLDWLDSLVASDPFDRFDDGEWELEACLLAHSAPVIDAERLGHTGRTRIVGAGERHILTARPRHGPDRPHGNRLLERATGSPATARGWSTLQRILTHER